MNMENTGKPQWLIDAEEELEKFHQTDAGKMTEKQFRRKTISQEWGSIIGKNNVFNGHWKKLAVLGGQSLSKEQKSKGGKNQSKEDKIKAAKISSNALYLFDDGSILKNIAAKNEFLKKNPNLSVTEVIYPEDSRYESMLKIRDEQDLKRRTCEHCNKPFHRKRIVEHRSHCKHKPV